MKSLITLLRIYVGLIHLPYLMSSGCQSDGVGVGQLGLLPWMSMLAHAVIFLPVTSGLILPCVLASICLVSLHTHWWVTTVPDAVIIQPSHLIIFLGFWAVIPLGVLRLCLQRSLSRQEDGQASSDD